MILECMPWHETERNFLLLTSSSAETACFGAPASLAFGRSDIDDDIVDDGTSFSELTTLAASAGRCIFFFAFVY